MVNFYPIEFYKAPKMDDLEQGSAHRSLHVSVNEYF